MKFLLFLSSTRVGTSYTGNGAWGDRVGNVVKERLENAGHSVNVWDPKVINFPLLQQPIQMIPDKSTIPAWLMERKLEIEEADGFVVCSSEYNSAMPPALTNMLDHFPPASFRHRPIGIVTYSVGSGGGMRVVEQLKAMVTDMGMVTVPATVKIDTVNKKFDEQDNCTDEKIKDYIDRLVKETVWYAKAIKNQKEAEGLPMLTADSAVMINGEEKQLGS